MPVIESIDGVAARLLVPAAGRSAPTGAVVAIAEGDEIRIGVAGVADVGTGAPVTAAHAQDLASVSKVLTTIAAIALVDRGVITFDTTVGAVLGGRSGHAASASVEDLLRHRAGFRPWWPLYLEARAGEDPVSAALEVPPIRPSGVERTYSDLGMQVLGAIIERVTGGTVSAAVRALVLDPLGADTITPGAPRDDLPTLSGPEGDDIEREMVRTGVPYPVDRSDAGFPWRTGTVVREIADGNAFHAFRGAAGHAGWFGDADGLLRVAAALADPSVLGTDPRAGADLAATIDEGQGLGVRRYAVTWRGRERTLLGHPGFTGAFLGAAPATHDDPPVRVVILANRLHGRPSPTRDRLADVDSLWRSALALADPDPTIPTRSGELP